MRRHRKQTLAVAGAVIFLVAGVAALPVFLSPMFLMEAQAQNGAPPSAEEQPPKVRELLNLLADPEVQVWIAQHRKPEVTVPVPTSVGEPTPSRYFAGRVDAVRAHLAALAEAMPKLPDELQRAGITLSRELQQRGLVRVVLLIVAFVFLGVGVEWIFHRFVGRLHQWAAALPRDTVDERLRAVAIRLAYGIGTVAAFAVGSVGAFLAFDWPPLLRDIVLGYLLVFFALRLTLVAGRFLLSPRIERFRILPMTTPAAWFWHIRLGLIVGWLGFGWVTVGLLGTLGVSLEVRHLIAYLLGVGLFGIFLECVWRWPSATETAPMDQPAPEIGSGTVSGSGGTRIGHGLITTWLLSGYFLLLWLLWVANALPAFWIAVVALGLPAAVQVTERAVNHVLRPPGAAAGDETRPGVIAASLARGLRTLLIIGAALLLAWGWGIDLVALTARDTLALRLLRGALNAVVIVLVADFAWHVMTALIDRKLAEAADADRGDPEAARRRARLRTLLPILRNILLVVLLVVTLLMALAALGIEIGPLIAGAGIVGVAIGFGAQTLVKDVISGVFYLLDDAFRVGEYIQSGNYKGTVESFSLRSIKLRHHRGPLYTVPFGELGAVENLSRDWVIDKMTVSVTYDTDLDKVKKLIKQIGKDLAQDPELAPHIIETLKMQGVEQFGDFAIQLRLKMMTRPGEQFVIRRRAYALIKKAFEANGIKFALPTVQVAGGEQATSAAAQQGLELVRPPRSAT